MTLIFLEKVFIDWMFDFRSPPRCSENGLLKMHRKAKGRSRKDRRTGHRGVPDRVEGAECQVGPHRRILGQVQAPRSRVPQGIRLIHSNSNFKLHNETLSNLL